MNLLLIVLLLSQWQWNQLPGPYLGYISDIEILDDTGTNLLACTWYGNFGGIYRSADGGQTWSISASGIDPAIGNGLNAIASSPINSDIVLCGTAFLSGNAVYRSTNGGQNWTQTSYTGGHIRGMKFFPGSSDNVLLIGGGIYKSTNSGITWALKQSVTNGRAFCFKRNQPDTIFAATQLGVLISTDQGETWANTPFDKYSYDIVADPEAPDSLYVAGLVLGVFRLRNNGTAYDSLGLGGTYNTTIAFDSISRKIYVGGYADNGRVRVSDDLGQSWYEYRSDQLFDSWINDLEIPRDNTNKVIAGCQNAGVCIMNPADSIWQLSSHGISQGVIRTIATAPTDPFVIYVSTSNVGVWRSTDGGGTWSTDPQGLTWGKSHQTEYFPAGLAVSPLDPDIVYATFWGVGPDYYHAVLKTTDGGLIWEEKTNGLDTIPSGHRIYWVATHPNTDDTLYLATSYGAFKSTDGGNTWVKKNSYHLYWIEVDPIEPNRLYATTACAAYYSDDGGETWSDRSNGLSNMSDVMMIDVDPQSNNIVYAALCGLETFDPLSGIYRSTDYGVQWVRMSSGLPAPPIMRPRVMVDTSSTSIWATTPLLGTGVPGVYRSLDQATSWFPEDGLLNTNRTMFLASGLYPLLGTQYSGIWSYHEVGIHEDKRVQKSKIFSIYPNPAKEQITIEYTLAKKSYVKINIIDCAGRVIEQLINNTAGPGVCRIKVPIELPSGVYFIDMGINGSSTTGRFVIIK